MTQTDNVEFIRFYAPQFAALGLALAGLLAVLAVSLKRRYGHLKPVLVDILDGGDTQTSAARWGVRVLALLTIGSVLALVLETEPSIYLSYGGVLMAVEVLCLAIFTAELLLRLWLAPEITRDPNRLRAAVRYLLSPMGLVDLLTVVPGWLFFFPGSEQLATFRILRLLRLLKLGQYAGVIALLDDVVRRKRTLLFATFSLAFIILVGASALMYALEGGLQPEKLGSIPQAMWWGVVTMATIGYGDVTPVTVMGKVLAGVVAFTGIGLFALPTAILATGLIEEATARNRVDDPCYLALKALYQAEGADPVERARLLERARIALEARERELGLEAPAREHPRPGA
ncbi:ion transporter [Calidithermus chliarophilus]|uniref:ion transporter n=1 Tax=Calidithermus chliarophilus TaxID=52023 RepID=UPI000419F0A4|nr:ion transporter [Calidithermus chliarophilus]